MCSPLPLDVVTNMHAFPSWLVRMLKCFLSVSTVVVLLLLSTAIFILINSDKSKPRLKPLRKRSWREILEGTGTCSHLANGTNLTVLQTCDEIRRDEEVFYTRRNEKVNPFPHKFVIDGAGVCDKHTDVIVLIHSLHSYVSRRNAIRDTWGHAAKMGKWPNSTIAHNISIAFVFGSHANKSWNDNVSLESRRYGDVIMGDFREAYKNMTLKSLLGLKWVDMFCSHARYLIKSDDDMIINIPRLLTTLVEANLTYGVMGPYNRGSKVLRIGKWAISHQVFPFFFYPPYESGSCYVISVDAVGDLFVSSEYVPWIFIDDVYITGILGKVIGLSHVLREGFAYWNSRKPKPCDMLQNRIITGTKMTPVYTRELWLQMMTVKSCL